MADAKIFDRKFCGVIAYIYIFCVLLALVEVQIEGSHGWASGYHLLMNGFLLLVMHQHFFLGLKWSAREEARALTRFVIIGTFWDLYWFLFNPAYGLGRFDHAHVWWHTQWVWGIPKHYLFMPIATMVTVVVLNGIDLIVTIKRRIVGEWNPDVLRLAWHGRWVVTNELKLLFATVGAFLVLTAATIAVATAVVPYRP